MFVWTPSDVFGLGVLALLITGGLVYLAFCACRIGWQRLTAWWRRT